MDATLTQQAVTRSALAPTAEGQDQGQVSPLSSPLPPPPPLLLLLPHARSAHLIRWVIAGKERVGGLLRWRLLQMLQALAVVYAERHGRGRGGWLRLRESLTADADSAAQLALSYGHSRRVLGDGVGQLDAVRLQEAGVRVTLLVSHAGQRAGGSRAAGTHGALGSGRTAERIRVELLDRFRSSRLLLRSRHWLHGHLERAGGWRFDGAGQEQVGRTDALRRLRLLRRGRRFRRSLYRHGAGIAGGVAHREVGDALSQGRARLGGDLDCGRGRLGGALVSGGLSGMDLTGEFLAGESLTGERLTWESLTGECLSREGLTSESRESVVCFRFGMCLSAVRLRFWMCWSRMCLPVV